MNDYNLLLTRLYDNGHDTLGMLYYFDLHDSLRYIFTLEDEYREVKQYGETRIPAGKYKLNIRKEGGFYNRYYNHKNLTIRNLTQKYGIIELLGVPQYEYVLIHIGNDEDDTAGCILVGQETKNNSMKKGWLNNSTLAYASLAGSIFHAMQTKDAYISIVDNDRNVLDQFKLI